ncbi:hypothetical protein LTR86_001893 [Recurvomyces mirabilis]|nr:hypothetical protein LTR86_001893 [Recurvomyces mirabilis]
MSGGSAMTCNRNTSARLAVIFLVLVGLFLFRNSWLPQTNGYRSHIPDGKAERPKPAHAPSPVVPPTRPVEEGKDEQAKVHTTIPTAIPTSTASTFYEECAKVPGADNILVLLKTGATEVYQKLPTHFVTTFACVPHFMIFSDLEQTFANYPIHDAIADISPSFRDHHDDFELYRKLQTYQQEGQDMSKLKGDNGWNLDKWKFLPMLHKAFESAGPEIEWFLMMEADTSVSWTNLLQWLKHLDPKKPYYMGAQNVIGGTTFAHGGSGVVVSRKTADLMREHRQSIGKQAYDEKWEELTAESCCGDEIIARALMEVDVPLTPAWPMIQGETVATLDWTENHWCTPSVTWHHVSPLEVDTMWQFQSSWVDAKGWKTPYLYRDVFEHFVSRHVSVNRTSWNNLSSDRKFVSASLASHDDEDYYQLKDYEQRAVESADACAEACLLKRDYECVQWMWTPGRCHLGKDIRFGKSDETQDDHWTAGWLQDRLVAFKEHFEGCKVKWHGAGA